MSYHVFFNFAVGFAEDLKCPKGTHQQILEHIAEVEEKLGLKARAYRDNPPFWVNTSEAIMAADDKTACEVVSLHNHLVRCWYSDFGKWFENPVLDGEVITVEDSKKFFYGLVRLSVPPEKWTKEYYIERMEHLYSVMRTGEDDGVSFDAGKLTIKQAAAVINLFSYYLDNHQTALEVPSGYDELVPDDDYRWCDGCGKPIHEDDFYEKANRCRRSRGVCEIKQIILDE